MVDEAMQVAAQAAARVEIGEGIFANVEDGELVLRIPLDANYGLTAGNNIRLASTHGFVYADDLGISMNVFRTVAKAPKPEPAKKVWNRKVTLG